LILTAALVLSLPGCGPREAEETAEPIPEVTPTPAVIVPVEEGNEFVLPFSLGGGFHPITGSNRVNLTLAPLMYRGLFAVDRGFEAQKDLCRDYSVSEDGLTWTFRLQEAVFSDGSPLTAAEAASSLNLARESARYGGRLKDLVRVTAEEGQVKVILSRPNGALPVLLDVPIVKETDDGQRPLGTGPYALEGEGETLELVARAGAEVPAEVIPLRATGSGDDLVYAFDAGEISLVDTDLTGTNALGYSGRLETVDYPTTGLLYLGFNTKSGDCRDEAVRQALARAVDRETAARQLLAGHGVASALPVHPQAPGYDAQVAGTLAYDMDAAREGLEKAGWSTDEEGRLRKGRSGLSLRLVVNQENTYKVTVAEAIGAALEELGCAVTVEKLPWDDFTAALARGEFDLYLAESLLTADFELEELLGREGTLNYGGYGDGETQALMDQRRAASGAEREAAASALYARLGVTAPIVPICFKNGSLLTQWGQVSGTAPTQRDVFAGLADWVVADP